ncbi:MAG: NADP-dependent oxidoreductase [Anaerolineales bacterium]|nr:NADP-dependent oxidoreductase [Anaerolineales bacterium]
MSKTNQQWRIAARPQGMIKESDFNWTEEAVPDLADGQILVRSVYLSLDPTNRGWMNDTATYLPPLDIGDVMRGFAIGVVEASKNERYQEGDMVSGLLGWQKYYVGDGRGLTPFAWNRQLPLDAYMGLFGMIGMTAYFGLLEVGEPKEGETLVVSGAAGAVGSLVGQIGKIKGLRVVGIAGGPEKCRYLTEELGFDAAIDYKNESVHKALKEHCPDGVDVYFENVGGEIMEAVLNRINLRARIVLCGLISQYNATERPTAPYNLANILTRRARMEGFIVLDYYKRADEATQALGQWYMEGKLKYRTDIMQGLAEAPTAVNKLFTGDKKGKLIVQVSELP